MLFAFLIPLIFGFLGSIFFRKISYLYLYDLGIITLTIGSIMKGILDIYGTTNKLINIYLIIAIGLIIIFLLLLIKNKFLYNNNKR